MEEDQQQETNVEEEFFEYDPKDWYSVAEAEFPEFTRDDVSVFISAFKQYDTDHSGAIDAKELLVALNKMGQGATQEDVDELISLVDSNQTGEIEWPEFLQIMRLFYPERRVQFVLEYLLPARKFPEFSESDLRVFIQTFREFDEDGSGAINKYELAKAFKNMGQGATPEEIEGIIREIDYDGSGEIEFGEFLLIMRKFYPDRRAAFIKNFYEPAKKFPEFSRDDIDVFVESFREFDLDNSGSIDAKELDIALKAMGQGASKEEIQQIINLVDANHSGEIEWPEFLAIMRFFYPLKRVQFVREFYGPARDFPEFSKGEIDVFIEAFKNFDADGSGAIDAQELGMALKSMGQGASPQDVQNIIRQVDADGSGEIEWPEFLQIMRNFYPNKMQEFEAEFYGPAKKFAQFSREDVAVFIEAFRLYDLDGSGAIDTKELGIALRSMGQGVTDDEVQQIATKFDANGSGEIDWPEFLAIMADLYEGKDLTAKAAPAPAQKQQTSQPEPTKQSPVVEQKFQTAAAPKPAQNQSQAPSATKVQVGAQRGNPKCELCGKTVYPIEAISSNDRTWHKGCFKCESEGCGVTLTLKTFTATGGKVYCSKHVPKDKPTSLTVEGSMVTLSQLSAPKVSKAQGVKKDSRTTFGPGELQPVDPKEP